MKRFIQQVQTLGQKALKVQQTMQGLPAKAAGVRQAVIQAKEQLQQLRADVEGTVGVLKTDNEEGLLRLIQEVDDSAELLASAGFALQGMEVELGLTARLLIHLERTGDVPESSVAELQAQASDFPTTQVILAALIKAGSLASRVQTRHLQYAHLTILVGPVPSVRLGWRVPASEPTLPPFLPTATSAPSDAPAFASVLGGGSGYFQQSSYFERKPPSAEPPPGQIPPPTQAPPPPPSAAPAPVTGNAPSPAPDADWRTHALDRFKKMPDLSRRPPAGRRT